MWDMQFEELIRRQLPFLPAEEVLSENASLREYGLDSLGTVELLSALEGAYQIRFSEEALRLETFATPAALWETLTEQRSASR